MGTIGLNDLEESRAREFMRRHSKCDISKPSILDWVKHILFRSPLYNTGPRRSKFEYIISPGPIGYGISIRCNYCGIEEDITDYESW